MPGCFVLRQRFTISRNILPASMITSTCSCEKEGRLVERLPGCRDALGAVALAFPVLLAALLVAVPHRLAQRACHPRAGLAAVDVAALLLLVVTRCAGDYKDDSLSLSLFLRYERTTGHPAGSSRLVTKRHEPEARPSDRRRCLWDPGQSPRHMTAGPRSTLAM